jgi:hypothetical protein
MLERGPALAGNRRPQVQMFEVAVFAVVAILAQVLLAGVLAV